MGEVLEVAAYMGHRTIGGWGPSKQEPMRDVGGLEEGGGGVRGLEMEACGATGDL